MSGDENIGYRYVPVRWFWFHWINALCILLLVFLAFVMMFRGEIGMHSFEAKIALKKLHVWVGYVFLANLAYRLLWSLLRSPGEFMAACVDVLALLRRSLKAVVGREHLSVLGSMSLSRLVIVLLFGLMATSVVSGLYRAGTDLYYPPFGGLIKQYVVKPGDDPDALVPRHWQEREQYVDADKQQRVGVLAKGFGIIHRYSGYVIMALVIVHIFVISKMFRIRRKSTA